MSKVKYFLKAGLLVKFRNGQFGVTDSSPKFGRTMAMRTYDGKMEIYNTSEWDDATRRHASNSDLDIISVWEIETKEEFVALCEQLGHCSLIVQWTNFQRPLWALWDLEEEEEEEEEEDKLTNDIRVRTSLTIMINDKPVDLNNLSPEERNILAQFGII